MLLSFSISSGWWFGTCFPQIGKFIIPIHELFHLFQRGVRLNKPPTSVIVWSCLVHGKKSQRGVAARAWHGAAHAWPCWCMRLTAWSGRFGVPRVALEQPWSWDGVVFGDFFWWFHGDLWISWWFHGDLWLNMVSSWFLFCDFMGIYGWRLWFQCFFWVISWGFIVEQGDLIVVFWWYKGRLWLNMVIS